MVGAVKSLFFGLVVFLPVFAGSLGPLGLQDEEAAEVFSGDLVRVIVSFETEGDVERFLDEQPYFVAYRTRSLPALILDVPVLDLAGLARQEGVLSVEPDRELPLLLDSSKQAIRADAVWGEALDGPIHHPQTGEVIDGSGIGVAVLDTGIDATHPDLKGRVVRNMEVVVGDAVHGIVEQLTGIDTGVSQPVVFIEGENLDEEGHGTHVSGIIAGEGNESDGFFRGVAPGASLYGIDVSHGSRIVLSQTVAAWDWVLENHDKVDPPIRVVNNSYGCGGNRYQEDFISNRQVDQAAEKGIVVVYAAGNGDLLENGGDGSTDLTSGCANHPKTLGVASYDDHGTGTRDGTVSTFSSRGRADDPATWPDISAPGQSIESTAATMDALGFVRRGSDELGNALFAGTLQIELGGVVSDETPWYFGNGAAVYNAHEDTFVLEPRQPSLIQNFPPWLVDHQAAEDVRYYQDVPEPQGPVHPYEASQVSVQPGDKITFRTDSDFVSRLDLHITAPTGDTVVAHARLNHCYSPCETTIDLYDLFPGLPADGTWTLSRSVPTSTQWSRPYLPYSGTSMAAPHVSGTAALVLQADPTLTSKDVIDILQTTAYKYEYGEEYQTLPHKPYVDSSFDKGTGLLDAQAAVQAAFTWEPIPDETIEDPDDPGPVEPIRTYEWDPSSVVDAWPHTYPGWMDFDVRMDDIGILAELRWQGAYGQGVDLVVIEPRECSIACLVEYWAFKEGEGTHRQPGDPMPATQGELRLWIDEETIAAADCPENSCDWEVTILPTLAVHVDYEVRITVVNEGELPEDYTAFDD